MRCRILISDDYELVRRGIRALFAARSHGELCAALQLPDDFGRLSGEMELAISRIVQECLTNVHRHSGSKSVEISVSRDDQNVSLEVRDRGKDMSREKLTRLQSRGGGGGIGGMPERVLQLGVR